MTEDQWIVSATMATGAVHHRLIEEGLRCSANIIVDTAEARDSHHFAVLLGFGATAVYPYLSYRVINDLVDSDELVGDPLELHRNTVGDQQRPAKDLVEDGDLNDRQLPWRSVIRSGRSVNEIVDLCFKGFKAELQVQIFLTLKTTKRSVSRLRGQPETRSTRRVLEVYARW